MGLKEDNHLHIFWTLELHHLKTFAAVFGRQFVCNVSSAPDVDELGLEAVIILSQAHLYIYVT